MNKVGMALTVAMAAIMAACTTTKDLERHPDLVEVDGQKTQEKVAASKEEGNGKSYPEDGGAVVDGAGAKKEPEAPSGTAEAGSPSEAEKVLPGAQTSEGKGKEGVAAPPLIVEKKVFIEKPIYYPENTSAAQTNPGEAVANATSQGVTRPRDYNGAMMLYDYDQTLVYQVYTMPLRVTDVYLQPGEKVIEQPFCGDTTRWNIGGGVSKTEGVDTQHLYLKPSEEGLETTLIINTDRRIYHLIIRSFKDTFMLAVMWRYPGCPDSYPDAGMPNDFLGGNEKKNGSDARGKQGVNVAEGSQAAFAVDPALISSDYTVSYPKRSPPEWLPTLVLDDGKKTYIVLPDTVVYHELPAVFGENGEIVNFRVKDNLVVIDRLMRKIQLKLRDVTVEIRKKGA